MASEPGPRRSVTAARISRVLREAGHFESDGYAVRDVKTARLEGFQVRLLEDRSVIAVVRWLPARDVGQRESQVDESEVRAERRTASQKAVAYATALKAAGYAAEVHRHSARITQLP